MKLISNSYQKALHLSNLNKELKYFFERFFNESQRLTDPTYGFSGISFEDNLERNFFDVSYLGVQLRFEFNLCIGEDGVAEGNIYCSKESPNFSKEKNIIGTFKFDQAGKTNFESDNDQETVRLQYQAIEIISHFIYLSTTKPLIHN
jgi:hypothetical protein